MLAGSSAATIGASAQTKALRMSKTRSGGRPDMGAAFQPEDPRARRRFDVLSVRIGPDAVRVVETSVLALPFAILTVFTRPDAEGGKRLLVVPPLAGAFPVLLRDLVVVLLRHAGTVAVAEWLDARYVPTSAGRFGFDENVIALRDMILALGGELNIVAVCQAVTPALAATALLAANDPDDAPRSLILVGGPVDPFANPTPLVTSLSSRSLRWFEDNLIAPTPAGCPGETRRVYLKERQFNSFLAFLQGQMLHRDELFWKLLIDDGENPLAFPFWMLASTLMDLPAEHFLENIHHVFHERSFCRGLLRIDGCRAEGRAIKSTGLMTVEGAEDRLAAPGQTRAAHDLLPSIPESRRHHLLVPASGHFSLFHGASCRTRVVPEIIAFINRIS
jgi:poly(3-hydroxybutyrate) depolymerase